MQDGLNGAARHKDQSVYACYVQRGWECHKERHAHRVNPEEMKSAHSFIERPAQEEHTVHKSHRTNVWGVAMYMRHTHAVNTSITMRCTVQRIPKCMPEEYRFHTAYMNLILF